MNTPGPRDETEDLRRQIGQTRADMGRTVTQIEYRVSPSSVARRQVRKVQGGLGRARTAVMGSPEYDWPTPSTSGDGDGDLRGQASEYADRAREQASEYSDRAREQASAYADQARATAQEAPERAREATAGNPLAAGLVAFGIGALAGTLLPASEPERRAAGKLREEFEEPAREEAQRAGEQVRDRVQSRAQEGAEQVKATAQEAADRTQGQAQASGERLQEHAKSASEDVRQR